MIRTRRFESLYLKKRELLTEFKNLIIDYCVIFVTPSPSAVLTVLEQMGQPVKNLCRCHTLRNSHLKGLCHEIFQSENTVFQPVKHGAQMGSNHQKSSDTLPFIMTLGVAALFLVLHETINRFIVYITVPITAKSRFLNDMQVWFA